METEKQKRFIIYKFNEKTRESEKLGCVNALNCPHAIKKGWDKFKVPYKNYDLSMIYARRYKKELTQQEKSHKPILTTEKGLSNTKPNKKGVLKMKETTREIKRKIEDEFLRILETYDKDTLIMLLDEGYNLNEKEEFNISFHEQE